jgi:hypothetical protein
VPSGVFHETHYPPSSELFLCSVCHLDKGVVKYAEGIGRISTSALTS